MLEGVLPVCENWLRDLKCGASFVLGQPKRGQLARLQPSAVDR